MINAIARFIATAEVPEDIQALGRPLIADCFGCMLAGATGEAATLISTVQASLSPGKVPLYGTDIGLTAPAAALANGVAAHVWDLDDWEEPGNTHPTAVILPALLAAAAAEHEEGRPVTGGQMLTAYAVGIEIIMRLGEAISMSHYARGFHSTATLGTIGAAAAVARLLGLDPERAGHALGLSVSGRRDTPSSSAPMPNQCRPGWPHAAALKQHCMPVTASHQTLRHCFLIAALPG